MIRLALFRLFLLFAIFLSIGAGAVHADARVALVVGNSDYVTAPELANPANDAIAIGDALERLGFAVYLGLDQNNNDFRQLIHSFSQEADGADLALFFYAGHGLQVDGKNYLIPVDAALEREADLDFAAVDLQLVLKQLERSAKNSIVLLDACRDNPFETSLTRSMGATRSAGSLGRGLAPVETLGGALIGFATDPGEVAFDGEGQHSPFTEALLKHIETPGLEINALMTRVRADVVTATNLRQRPWATSSLLDELYLNPETATAPNPTLKDVAAWRAAEAAGAASDYRSYLEQFPNGLFAEQATRALGIVSAPAEPQPEADPFAIPEETELAAIAPPPARPEIAPVEPDVYAPISPQNDRFVTVPAGQFEMGSASPLATEAEKPPVSVTLAGFQMLREEVTVGNFRDFMVSSGHRIASGCYVWTQNGRLRWNDAANWENPGFPVTDDMPVACVNWEDAQAYASWLSATSGSTHRLPSEAEFEYALRAGTSGDYAFGGGAAAACAFANGADASSRFRWRNMACDDGQPTVARAADLAPNAFGLTAMIGNLWEWTTDCWNPSHQGVTKTAPARQTGQCGSRVLRGGSWDDPLENLRSSYRVGIKSGQRQANIGFRIMREP